MSKASKAKELSDFEISFYERLVSDYPDFVDALMALGEAYTRRGWHDKGLAVDERLAQLKAHDPVVWYNLACSYSLMRRCNESLTALRQAITLGYDDFNYLLKDTDLLQLRSTPQFHQFLKSLTSQGVGPSPHNPRR